MNTSTWLTLPRVGFDTETTGRDPKDARLVTCSVVVQSPEGTQEKYYWLADPGVDIPEEASAIHGISTAQAQAEGRPVVEVLEEIAQLLCSYMARGIPVVAYNAGYDLTLLENELVRHGLPRLSERLGGEIFPVIDPYFLDRWGDRYRKSSGRRKLINLVELYGCTTSENFHNAEEDVLATLRLLDAMIHSEHLTREIHRIHGIEGGLAGMSLRELHNAADEAHRNLITFIRSKNPERQTESLEWPIY